MNKKELPIGFFDSGVGGVSVLKQTMQLLPNEHYIYLGDNANVPYGTKTEEEIKRLAVNCGEFLYQKGVKMIVVACNTATSIAIHTMRERFNIPVISIEPAVKPAIDSGIDGKVIVMATPATIMQSRYNKLLDRIGHREKIINMPCTGLADIIENEHFDDEVISKYLEDKFVKYKNENVFGVVLGCTHYSFGENAILKAAKSIFGHSCNIYDGKYGVANQVKRVLEREDLKNDSSHMNIKFYASGNQDEIEKFKRFLIL